MIQGADIAHLKGNFEDATKRHEIIHRFTRVDLILIVDASLPVVTQYHSQGALLLLRLVLLHKVQGCGSFGVFEVELLQVLEVDPLNGFRYVDNRLQIGQDGLNPLRTLARLLLGRTGLFGLFLSGSAPQAARPAFGSVHRFVA